MKKLKIDPKVKTATEQEIKDDPNAAYRLQFFFSTEDPNYAFKDIPDEWFTEFADAYNDVCERYFNEVIAPVMNEILGQPLKEQLVVDANYIIERDTYEWTSGENIATYMAKLMVETEEE
jgi:alcohol dehydrogenase YqhD (iron-dependent ADH family)